MYKVLTEHTASSTLISQVFFCVVFNDKGQQFKLGGGQTEGPKWPKNLERAKLARLMCDVIHGRQESAVAAQCVILNSNEAHVSGVLRRSVCYEALISDSG